MSKIPAYSIITGLSSPHARILENQATYKLIVENMAKVKEEYLIYDTVSMISVVGGFMGLCVGFSFYDTSGVAPF